MFEEYLQDSFEFFEIAQHANSKADTRKARRYYRASVFYATGAMEAFINYIADGFANSQTLQPHEIAFLNDRAFTPKNGKLIEQTRYYNVEDKLRFLISKFTPGFNFGTNPSWSKFTQFKSFRDSLVHPRQSEDEMEAIDYEKRVRSGLSGIIGLMNEVSKSIYNRPLRKQLLDLIPE
ncbi:MAG: hypothetical protein JW725_02580 [Candidatus Babeliaceae bacterium]|nr:hypothetical protein [Candidatus Babeliaceae bacterium]